MFVDSFIVICSFFVVYRTEDDHISLKNVAGFSYIHLLRLNLLLVYIPRLYRNNGVELPKNR
jgi:hypothetical protein